MKKLLTLALTLALVALGSISWASINLNSSRSNVYLLIYPADVMSQAQATAIVAEFDKAGKTVGAGQVTEIIKKHGVRAEAVKKILILPPDKTRKVTAIILLTDLADEAPAREIAVSDSGVVVQKPPPIKIK
jgi:hypothetical protein